MSIDNRVLEQRLITKDSVIGLSSSLTKCAVKLLGFAPDKDSSVANVGLESFVREMMVYELELKKSCRLLLASDGFAHEYDGIEQTICTEMEDTKRQISQLEIDLQHAQEIRKHRFACEVEASNVNKLTAVSTLKRKIDEVEENVKECEETTMTVEAQIATRKEQFRQLEQLLSELGKPLDADEKQVGVDEVDEENNDDSGGRGGGGGSGDRSSKKLSTPNQFTDENYMQLLYLFCMALVLIVQVAAFIPVNAVAKAPFGNRLKMADVEVEFPNKKKVKVPSGSPLKEAAKKAGFTPNYGCEEGKCGSCELKLNGKQKIRPCIGKVPATATKLENL